MRISLKKLGLGLAFAAISAFGQSKPAFEVATVKPAAPLDQAKMLAAIQGGKMPVGAEVDNRRAEFKYLDLKSLISYAYGVKPFQITGPDWMSTTRFDILAKMPEGSTKSDAAKMLQSLLEERFKLETHRTSAEHPVLALVVGKGGPKLKASAETPVAIDESEPLKQGEMKLDGPDGPIRVKVDLATGGSVIDMGLKGKMSYKVSPATMTMKMEFSMTTMGGFADMLTQMFTLLGGANGGRQVVDMTDVKGNYDASLELSLTDILALVRAQGMEIPAAVGAGAGRGGTGVASDPSGGGATLQDAVQSMGLKLESRKAVVDQFVVDHVEKTPTEN